MTPLVQKFSISRYSLNKPDYNFWKHFHSINSLICFEIIGHLKSEKFKVGSRAKSDSRPIYETYKQIEKLDVPRHLQCVKSYTISQQNKSSDSETESGNSSVNSELSQTASTTIVDVENINSDCEKLADIEIIGRQDSGMEEEEIMYKAKTIRNTNGQSTSTSHIMGTVENCRELTLPLPIEINYYNSREKIAIQKLFNMFHQVHQDHINSCFYLEGMYENATYFLNRLEDSYELISVSSHERKQVKNVFDKKALIRYVNSDFDMLDFGRGHEWDFNFMTGKIRSYLPLKPIQRLFIFLRISTALITHPDQTSQVLNRNPVGSRLTQLAIQKYKTASPEDTAMYYENLIKTMNIMEDYENHSLTLKFLWSFDYRSGNFFLNENAYFNLKTIESRVLTYYNRKFQTGSKPESGSETKIVKNAENLSRMKNEFISNLYCISKSLSTKPKFQLILISLAYMTFGATKYIIPFFDYQNKTFENYFSPEQVKVISQANDLKVSLLEFLKRLLVHFNLFDMYHVLTDIIPKAVEMELFILSEPTREFAERNRLRRLTVLSENKLN